MIFVVFSLINYVFFWKDVKKIEPVSKNVLKNLFHLIESAPAILYILRPNAAADFCLPLHGYSFTTVLPAVL